MNRRRSRKNRKKKIGKGKGKRNWLRELRQLLIQPPRPPQSILENTHPLVKNTVTYVKRQLKITSPVTSGKEIYPYPTEHVKVNRVKMRIVETKILLSTANHAPSLKKCEKNWREDIQKFST